MNSFKCSLLCNHLWNFSSCFCSIPDCLQVLEVDTLYVQKNAWDRFRLCLIETDDLHCRPICQVDLIYCRLEVWSQLALWKVMLTLYSVACLFFTAVDCGGLPPSSNATVSYSSTTYQSVATYMCLRGFEAVGFGSGAGGTENEANRICQASGLWSGQPLQCSGE